MFALRTLLLASVAVAMPVAELAKRQSSTTCGNNYYSAGQISDAANAAYNYYSSGDEAGSSTYPHQYNDYEGFDFGGVEGPYQEFPLLESGVYNGGSPGADRVIINSKSFVSLV